MPLSDIETALESGAFAADPHRWYDRLRSAAPVYFSPYLDQWLVTSYEHAEEALLRTDAFSNYGFNVSFIERLPSETLAGVGTLRHHYAQRGLIQTDPPEHTRLRRLVGPFFSAKAVSALEPAITRRVDRLLDEAGDDFDVVNRLARPLSVDVIAEFLGVPEEHRHRFPVWSSHVIRFYGAPSPDPAAAMELDRSLEEWRALVLELLAERSRSPRRDFLTEMARFVDDGVLTTEEALFTSVHLLIAGHETTAALIANTIATLLRHPDQRALVSASPERLRNAVEETLRFEPSITRVRRLAPADAELGGAAIAGGQAVSIVLSAANRDPARYPDPGVFRVDRDERTSPHLSFGRGRHFCLGANLARLEAPIAVRGFLDRFPAASLDPHAAQDWRASINHRALESLHVATRSPGEAA